MRVCLEHGRKNATPGGRYGGRNGAATQVTIAIEGWDRAKTIFSDRPPRQDCRWHRSHFSPPSIAPSALELRKPPGSKPFPPEAAARRSRWAESHSARSQKGARRRTRAETPNPAPPTLAAVAPAAQRARSRQA